MQVYSGLKERRAGGLSSRHGAWGVSVDTDAVDLNRNLLAGDRGDRAVQDEVGDLVDHRLHVVVHSSGLRARD